MLPRAGQMAMQRQRQERVRWEEAREKERQSGIKRDVMWARGSASQTIRMQCATAASGPGSHFATRSPRPWEMDSRSWVKDDGCSSSVICRRKCQGQGRCRDLLAESFVAKRIGSAHLAGVREPVSGDEALDWHFQGDVGGKVPILSGPASKTTQLSVPRHFQNSRQILIQKSKNEERGGRERLCEPGHTMTESLEGMSRAELQALAKKHGLKANMKTADLITHLKEKMASGDGCDAAASDAVAAAPAKAASPTPAKGRKGGKKAAAAAELEDEEASGGREEEGSCERDALVKLGRAKIQAMCKAKGLKAGGKTDDLVQSLLDLAEQESKVVEEEVPAPKSAQKEKEVSKKRKSSTGAKAAAVAAELAEEEEKEEEKEQVKESAAVTPKSASKGRRSSAAAPVPASSGKKSAGRRSSTGSSAKSVQADKDEMEVEEEMEEEEEEEEEEEAVVEASPAKSRTPRRSSVMLRDARCKRRSSAASRKSFTSVMSVSTPRSCAPPNHPAAMDQMLPTPARKAATPASSSKQAAVAGKKRKRVSVEVEAEVDDAVQRKVFNPIPLHPICPSIHQF